MAKAKVESNGSFDAAEVHAADAANEIAHEAHEAVGHDADEGIEEVPVRSDVVATVATVAVVGVGAAALEAALLPGIVLGVAAMWLPQYFPKMGEALNPLFRSTVRSAYKLGHKTREMMAEAQEQFHDIAAEVHAEKDVAAEA